MRARAVGALAAAGAIAAAAPCAAEEADAATPRYEIDAASGQRFRVAFDPASRFSLGIAGAATRGRTGAPAAAPEIDAGLTYRSLRASGAGKERVVWQIEQRVLAGWAQPLAGLAPRVPALDAALYGVALHRHDASPSLVLPTSPPVGIPFPFDVGMDAEAGRVAVSSIAKDGAPPVLHVGVLRGALLLDPWRSGVPGRILALGIGARYDLDVVGAPTLAAARVVHRVAPMTAGSIRFRVESRDGLSVADARAEIAPEWSSEGAWALAAGGAIHLDRALLAVADQPVRAFLDGGFRRDPATRTAPATSDLRVALGLAIDLSLR